MSAPPDLTTGLTTDRAPDLATDRAPGTVSRPASWVRRHRVLLTIVVLVVATITALTLLTAVPAGRTAPLDPQNPSPDGAQAVARVLADRGVQVTVVRRAALLQQTRIDSDTTVVVTGSANLGRSSARQLEEHTSAAGALVLPDLATTLDRALDLPIIADDERAGGRAPARCDDPLLTGLELRVPPSSAFRARGGGSVVSCFTGPGPNPPAWVVRVNGAVPRPTTYVVGAAALFTNRWVDESDNAAVALRLLGQRDRLVWYVPDVRDVKAGDTGSLASQLPGGLVPAVWLLGASVVATMLWRGRRLGPLVLEPLPVVVKAVESTQGRGRLYRRVRDRSHAAAILREATCRRLAARLRLPPGTETERLVAAVAEAAATDPATEPATDLGGVRDVLVARPVTDDRSLIRLAADLAALERKVHP